jgi:hypothetical protein
MSNPITELATGTIDGANFVLETSRDYAPGSLRVFRNGFVGEPATELGGKSFALEVAPSAGDVITVYYRPI